MQCPSTYCFHRSKMSGRRPLVVRDGRFYRKSDHVWIRRYRCSCCKRRFSSASQDLCFQQNKRQKNEGVRWLLCSGVSQRRAAQILRINRKTVVRKLLFLAELAKKNLEVTNIENAPVVEMQFDDLETLEHTKLKPLSITLAVASSRRILGFAVASMPAKGLLAKLSRAKYGFRRDDRSVKRKELFSALLPHIDPLALIKSDQNPHYPPDVKSHFPKARHEVYKGRRGCVVGQGELKKIGFDPLFSLNHTCAMLRDDINRLRRKTWCTTKKPQRLEAHLYLYADFQNQRLAEKQQRAV